MRLFSTNSIRLALWATCCLFITTSFAQGSIATDGGTVLIDFDNSTSGISNGTFLANGISAGAGTAGHLDENGVHITDDIPGAADIAATFGAGTSTNISFQGTSTGGVGASGNYAFDVDNSSGVNRALGFQPSGSRWSEKPDGDDGHLVFKFDNNSGVTLTAFQVKFSIYEYNDQARSSTIESYLTTDVSTPAYGTVRSSYATPLAGSSTTWVNVDNEDYIVSTGLSVAPGASIYLRFYIFDSGGSNLRDEFAIDDISVQGASDVSGLGDNPCANDTEPPTISCLGTIPPVSANANCMYSIANIAGSSPLVVAMDNCGTPTLTQSPLPGTMVGVGTTVITITATDGAGLMSTCTYNLTVVDNTPPMALCQDIMVQVDPGGNASITTNDVDGGSSDNCGITSMSVTPTAFTCSNIGDNTVVLTVTDANNNSSNCNATVTIEDPNSSCCTGPVAMCNNVTVELDAAGYVNLAGTNFSTGSSAACGISSEVILPYDFTCVDIGEHTVTYTISDINGASATCMATVTVEDNITPTISCPSSIVVDNDPGICGAEIMTDLSPTASDNCNYMIQTTSNPEQGATRWAWGKETYNGFGNGPGNVQWNTHTQTDPSINWQTFALGSNFGLGIHVDGSLWTWGTDDAEQLGNGAGGGQNTPMQVSTATWIAVAGGQFHSLGLQADGSLWAWGSNSEGQLGLGQGIPEKSVPTQIGTNNWTALAASSSSSYAIQANGTLWSWGRDLYGELGNGIVGSNQHTPQQAGSDNDWAKIVAYGTSVFAIKQDGTLWAWGSNDEGQLGIGSNTDQSTPVQIGNDTHWVNIACGFYHTLAIKTDGTIWTWGSDESGTLGQGSGDQPSNFPVQMGTSTEWRSVFAGPYQSFAIKQDGSLWGWGRNYRKESAPTSSFKVQTPYLIDDEKNWKMVAGKFQYSMALAQSNIFPVGTTTLTYDVTDPAGNMNACSFTVTVQDVEAPTISCPANETISTDVEQCTATYTVAQPDAMDNCSVAQLRYRYRAVDENCDNIPGVGWSSWSMATTQNFTIGKWKIQWEARDAANNKKRCTFCVTVEDGRAPVAVCKDITVQIGATGMESVEPDDIDNSSSDNCGIVSKTINGFDEVILSCVNVGANNMAELKIFDEAGNSHSCLSNITVEDNIDPKVTCSGLGFTTNNDAGECSANVDLPVPPATDNCEVETLEYRYRLIDDGGSSIGPWSSWTDESNNNVTLDVGRYRVRWRATDPSGNKDACNYIVNIVDVEPPMIDCFDQDIVFDGEEIIPLLVEDLADASDNCGIASLTLDINEVLCEQLGEEITVTATAVDENGLMNICTSTVNVLGLPCGWSDQPIGCDGSTSYDVPTETFSLNSNDCHNAITNETDEYAFAAYNLCGNGSITAKVTSIVGTSNGWAGVMMRESVDPLAKSVTMMTNLSSNHRREVRKTTGGNVTSQLSPAFNRHWLRISRVGNSFRIYASSNGISWFLRSSQTVSMQACIEVGLVVNGYVSSNDITATFENVVVEGATFFDLQANAPTTAELAPSEKALNVYPNPTTGQVTIALGDFLEQEARLEVLDLNGQLVQLAHEGILENSTEKLNLEQLPAGLYFIRLQLADGTIQTQRVVLQPQF